MAETCSHAQSLLITYHKENKIKPSTGIKFSYTLINVSGGCE